MKRKKSDYLRAKAYHSIAEDLREFGYPDVTAAMIQEIYEAYENGVKPLPHGVIGLMVLSQLDKAKH